MSATTIRRHYVDAGVLTLLVDAGLDFAVGDAEVPAYDPDAPKYAILEPIPGGENYNGPPLTAPDADASLVYQVKCVGADKRQSAWVADEVRRVFLSRNEHGAFVHVLELEAHTEMDRSPVFPIGAPELVAGVWQTIDTYEVGVSRA